MANSSSQLNSSIDAASVPAVTGLTDSEVSRVIEMAWEDRTPFEAIEGLFKLNESAVISLMRRTHEAAVISSLAQTRHRPQNQASATALARRQSRLLPHSIQARLKGTQQ